jgi:hypothetical protein
VAEVEKMVAPIADLFVKLVERELRLSDDCWRSITPPNAGENNNFFKNICYTAYYFLRHSEKISTFHIDIRELYKNIDTSDYDSIKNGKRILLNLDKEIKEVEGFINKINPNYRQSSRIKEMLQRLDEQIDNFRISLDDARFNIARGLEISYQEDTAIKNLAYILSISLNELQNLFQDIGENAESIRTRTQSNQNR